uniref:Uncharacterized protein n=1 Tax=Arion vulgaris TaxID=1028688 RepID=A0A0B7A2M4_9EUPU
MWCILETGNFSFQFALQMLKNQVTTPERPNSMITHVAQYDENLALHTKLEFGQVGGDERSLCRM